MKSLVSSFLLISLAVVINQVSVSDAQGCICTFQYDPVCGTNGRTFGNSCQLNCERDRNPNLSLAYRGECRGNGQGNNNNIGSGPGRRPERQQGCFCTLQYDPVCGSDGITYGNSCQLGCQSNARLVYRGPCRRGRGQGGRIGSGITSA